jgi:ketol-acid reductoisomerase
VKLYYEKDGSLDKIKEKKVCVLGFGNQGKAHALNLKNSGVDVVVALRPNSTKRALAEKYGFQVKSFEEGTKESNVLVFLLPDQVQKGVYEKYVEKNLKDGDTLLFAHGFNIHFEEIKPPKNIDVVMVAPKSPGHLVRETYLDGKGTPCLGAVWQNPSNSSWELVLSYAMAIGGLKAGTFTTTFKDETETDLFGEQVVLCGGVSELVKMAFETLTEEGYPKELAYFECLHELKLIVDLFYEGGLSYMNEAVSETAEYGGYTRGPRILPQNIKLKMREVLDEIKRGDFSKEYLKDARSGQKKLLEERQKMNNHDIEEIGKELRKNMSWLKSDSSGKGEKNYECRV